MFEHYNLHNKALSGYVYMEICKGMYGLLQAGILANKLPLLAYGNMTPAQFGSILQYMSQTVS